MKLRELAQLARPIDEKDWASNRQVDAENNFFYQLERKWPLEFNSQDFADFCLKATTDEMIDEALKMLGKRAEMEV